MAPTDSAPSTSRLEHRARLLAWATVGWNVLEAVVALAAGTVASSIALVSFGLDSMIEVFSAVVILWQFHGIAHDREERARRLIAFGFFGLAGYVAVQALVDLIASNEPESSPVGIALAIASLVVMPALAMAKRATGHRLGSHTVVADSNQTKLCAYLSVVLLVGLLLNAGLGWWWADPLAALGIAVLALNEGREAWRGDLCCD
jgi:divalent metal cation (Fe/Co/Zn/Cd) transporter